MTSYIRSWLRRVFRGHSDEYRGETPTQKDGAQRFGSAEVTVDGQPARPQGRQKRGAVRQPESIYSVGLDVGTASTKIVVRDVVRTNRPPVVLRVGNPVDAYPSIGTPTTIGVRDGKAYFGSDAETLVGAAIKLRSFKMCVACQHGLLECRGCPARRDDNGNAVNGQFVLSVEGQVVHFDAEDLFTLYVAWLRTSVSSLMESHLAVRDRDRIIWNMSVPLGQIDNDLMSRVFCRMLAMSMALDRAVKSGMDFALAIELVRGARTDFRHATDLAELPISVVPETLAAIQGFIQRRETALGMYGIIDVGAGTTDVSFFKLRGLDERALSFYGAGSAPLGGDDFDLAVVDAIASKLPVSGDGAFSRAELATLIRAKRPTGQHTIAVGGREFDFADSRVHAAEQQVASGVWHTAHTVLGPAWRKLKRASLSQWKKLPLLLVGGGSRHPLISEVFRRHLLLCTEEQPIVPLSAPSDLVPGPGISATDIDDNNSLLLVAEGLSYPSVAYPELHMPSEIKDFPKPEILERIDTDELYST